MVHRRPLGDDVIAVLRGPLPPTTLPEPAVVSGLDGGRLAAALDSRITRP